MSADDGRVPGPGGAAEHDEIDSLLATRAVTSVFQPVVALDTGETVGFEALARGPVDTPLHTAPALFAAARAAGRTVELDWVCRAAALEAAAAADLPPGAAVFVNVETGSPPATCPPDLSGVIARAEASLRVVVEVDDRGLRADPAGILATIDHARAIGWGVCVDDVAESTGWLSLLPMLAPDVVKLDIRRLRDPDDDAAAAVVAATRHVEATGATLVVKGVENAADERLARALGATHGQGHGLGLEAPLPSPLRAPRAVIPLLAGRGSTPPATSLWDAVADRPSRHVDAGTFHETCSLYVHRALVARSRAVLLGGLGPVGREAAPDGTPDPWRPITGASELAGRAGLAAHFAVGSTPAGPSRTRAVSLHSADPLAEDRFVLLMTESLAVVVVGRKDRATGLLDLRLSQDPYTVDSIARHLIARIPPEGSPPRALRPPVPDTSAEETVLHGELRPDASVGPVARLRTRLPFHRGEPEPHRHATRPSGP
nr:EAL domain-containing protein [uncultured Actinotalea sp.]